MIAPRNRLLFWFAVVALPFSALAAVYPPAWWAALGLMAALLAVVLADMILTRGVLAGIRLELPPVARLSQDREGKLEVRVQNPGQNSRTLRLALEMPETFESSHDELLVTLPADSQWSRLTWACRPLRRGNFRLTAAYVEGKSPLGFWSRRTRLPVSSELRVYPNMRNEQKNLGLLFLNRGTFGIHAQRQLGKGREFEKLREYVPGDGYEDIHWKATARRGHPITKVFQIERTQEIYLVLDASRLSARENVLERFLTAALVVGAVAEQQGDLFGLLAFSDRVDHFVRARTGKTHYSACRDAIYALEPRPVNPDYDEVCSFIRLRLRRRALILFLTALDDPVLAESFVRNISLVSRQHLVLVNMAEPSGMAPLFSRPEITTQDDLYDRLGGHLRWHSLQELNKVLQRRGVAFSVLAKEQLTAQLVSQYLNVKRRQLL